MEIVLHGWEDGVPVQRTIDALDRWEVHAADRVSVDLAGVSVSIQQQPNSLTASKVGVGACIWDAAFVLAAFLGEEPRHRLIGSRVVELGAGAGFLGIFLATLGAQVTLTDKTQLLPLLRCNLTANKLDPESACELEWGAEGFTRIVKRLGASGPQLVVAADCLYIDGEGRTPSVADFVGACAGMCGPKTRCLIGFEPRSDEIQAAFLDHADRTFAQVKKIPKKMFPKYFRSTHVEIYELKGPRIRIHD